MSKLTAHISELLISPIEQAGYELWYVDYKKEGKQWFLRLFVDHTEGVGIDDCIKINDLIAPILELEDPIPQEYTLEVSSPGIFRPLITPEHFQRFLGKTIKVHLFQAVDGKKQLKGELRSATSENFLLVLENQESIDIPYSLLAQANLDPKLEF